ncbi:hypothetical protein GE278_23930 (plasmid) [Enterobacteriaceae bacterium Kacie_13]|nr:hypothetical protein GE278_23930 [Enterobacteriaceae bacterium Kacie_13]
MTNINSSVGRDQLTKTASSDFSFGTRDGVQERHAITSEEILKDAVAGPRHANDDKYKYIFVPAQNRGQGQFNRVPPSNFYPAGLTGGEHIGKVFQSNINKDKWSAILPTDNSTQPRRAQNTIPENVPVVELNAQNTHDQQLSVSPLTSFFSETLSIVDAPVDAIRPSLIGRYGGLAASSISTILGAILVIIAKTHGHDDIDVEEAEDFTPQAPDYDAISAQASEQAEHAFNDKWLDPGVWGPGHVDENGRNTETGEINPYFTLERDDITGEYKYVDTLTREGESTRNEVKEQAADAAVSQAKADYQQALDDAMAHNGTHPGDQHISNSSGKDHDAMLGIGATLIGVGGLAATLIGGNKILTNYRNTTLQSYDTSKNIVQPKNLIESYSNGIKP